MKCENCNKKHDGSYGSGRFCSKHCSHSFCTKNKRKEINKKVSSTMTGRKMYDHPEKVILTCEYCSKEFEVTWKYRNQQCCSKKCSSKYKGTDIEYRKKLSDAMKRRVELGIHSGWQSRSKLKPSYAEQFFMKVLDNNDIKYQHELRCDKYFIDFAIEDKRIALEIDGKQHNMPNRVKTDKQKDKVLKENGWLVHRIKWKSINNDTGKKYIKEEIDKFIQFYNRV